MGLRVSGGEMPKVMLGEWGMGEGIEDVGLKGRGLEGMW